MEYPSGSGPSATPPSGGVGSPSPPSGDFDSLLTECPRDPADIIIRAALGTEVGIWTLSDTYDTPTSPSVWVDSPVAYVAPNFIVANESDNQQIVFDGRSWNFLHQATTKAVSSLAPPLRSLLFARAGRAWTNSIPLLLPVSPMFTELQLSFLDNAATRGDSQGTIPVYKFSTTGPFFGAVILDITFARKGRFRMGLLGINSNATPDWSMFEMDIVVE